MNKVVEEFLEKNNMDYLFLLLANLEVERLANLPYPVRKKFDKKITEMALEHVAKGEIPDYVVDGIPKEEESDES
ncbi:MAG: hypothetical protein SVM86_06260 [Candidatus Cloacimonadota bacterium]|nr:hypothetical protein [Candidatus Cloacimonadota bacterium]